MGNAMQTSADAMYGARHSALKAGLSIETPALTVNRLCGSGIQSVISAAQLMLLGEAEVTVAGGMENMTQAPHVIRGARDGFKLGQGALEDSLMVALLDTHCGLYMAQTAEKLAAKYGIDRKAMDEFSLRSQQTAAAAKARVTDAANARAAEEEAVVNARIAEAETAIGKTRDAAMTNVASIASDTAAAIVERLTGKAPTAAEAAAAVKGAA